MSEDVRRNEQGKRNRRLRRGVATALACRVVTAVSPFFVVPITLGHVGKEVYGLWMAVAALTAMAAFADLGLGNGLMTKLAGFHARGDVDSSRQVIGAAYAILSAVAFSIAVLMLVATPFVPWHTFLGVENPALFSTARNITSMCLILFVINIPLSLVVRVQFGLQQVAQSYLWQSLGPVLSIVFAIGAIGMDASAELTVFAVVVGPLIANIVNTIWCFRFRNRKYAPRLDSWRGGPARSLLRLGSLFFLLTIVMSLANNADPIVIPHYLNLASVTDYAVPARIFAQIGFLVALVSVPLWPANAEALAKGDLEWVRRSTRRMSMISVCAVILPLGIATVAGEQFIGWWVGPDVLVNRSLLAGLAMWWVVLAALSPYFMVQNAAGVVAPQLLGWFMFLVISVGIKIVLLPEFGIGVLPWVSVVAYVVTVAPCAAYGYRLSMRQRTLTNETTSRSQQLS